MTDIDVREQVSEFYGQTVQRTEDLAFDAGCVADYDASPLDAIPADMLTGSRYAAHFEVSAPMLHMGPFDCGPRPKATPEDLPSATGCC